MLHPSTQKLIDRLAAMTAQKKINWMEKGDAEVAYNTEGYVVRLSPEPPRMLLETETGKTLEDVGAEELKSAPHAEGGTYGDLVTTLARDAYRRAHGTEDAIDALLKGLDSTEPAEAEAEETEEADTEEETAAASEPSGEPAVEDQGDSTAVLTSEEAEAVAEETPEDLVDVSVPEKALLGEDEDEDAEDEDEQMVSADAEADEADGDEETDEDYVGSAVARLADEVNAQQPDVTAEAESAVKDEDEDETADAIAAEASDSEAAEETGEIESEDLAEEPRPSYAVMPDETPVPGVETEDSGPVDLSEGPAIEPVVPDAPQAGLEADSEEEAEEITGWDRPDDVADESPVETAEPAEAAADEIADEDEPTEAVAPEAPVSNVHYVPFGAAGTQAVGADASDDAPVEAPVDEELGSAATMMSLDEDAALDAIAGADEEVTGDEVDETPAGFMAGQVEGAEVSQEEPPVDEPVDEEIAAAATTMTLDEESAETAGARVEDQAEADESAVADAEPARDEPVSAPVPPSPVRPQVGPLSLSGLGGGFGFGATPSRNTPAPPRSPEDVRAEQPAHQPSSVVIDATADFPTDFSSSAGNGLPEVSEAADEIDPLEDVAVSQEDLDAVSPPEPAPAEDPTLSLVETETGAAPEPASAPAEEETEQPVRPKTRFNPWT